LSARFADPDRLLVEFIAWLEASVGEDGVRPPARGTSDEQAFEPAPRARARSIGDRERLARERRRLIEAAIDVSERVSSPALAQRLIVCLEDVGVEPISVDRERFDPRRHRAVARVPTTDTAKHNTVAETQRVGYRDGDEILRPPEVSVYRADAHRD
jgi:hypothetical protein